MCIAFFCLYPYASPRKINGITEIISEIHEIYQSETSAPDLLVNQDLRKSNIEKISLKTPTEPEHKGEGKGEKQKIKFIIGFNRDERSQRKTLKLGPFKEDPNIYAGRDAKSTGTWLGINIKTGIMVVLTNYDWPHYHTRHGRSRGQLVQSYLNTASIPEHLHDSPKQIDEIIRKKLTLELNQYDKYPAHNLLVFNMKSDCLFYICSEIGMKEPALLSQHTVYGLCNTDINTIWPKTKHGCHQFQNILKKYEGKSENQLMDALSKVMKDTKRFSPDLNDEASIFVQPFYSTLSKAEKMTKSTFLAVVKTSQQNQKPKISINMRQITHKNMQQVLHMGGKLTQKYQTKRQLEGYEHISETKVDFELNL